MNREEIAQQAAKEYAAAAPRLRNTLADAKVELAERERQYEVFEEADAILPSMNLPNPCGVRIEIHNDYINLYVGRRDWCWNRKTGILSGVGFEIEHPMSADPREPDEDVTP